MPGIVRRLLDRLSDTSDDGLDIPCESFVEHGRWVARFQVAGIDPARDLAATVENGHLRVRAHRRDHAPESRHSEFTYGILERVLPWPPGTMGDQATASCVDGVLTVTVPLGPSTPAPHLIPVVRNRSSNPDPSGSTQAG